MAQPAVPVKEDRTDLLGIPPFWAKTSVNPPFIWETWLGQFFLAVSLKDNISPGELLVAPAELVDEPYPKPEAPSTDENAADVADRNLRMAAANRRIDEYNQERRRKGPRIGHNWCYHEAEARLKSRLFFALGNEGKNDSWILTLIWTSTLALSLIFTSAARRFSRQSGTTQSKGLSCIIQFSCKIMTHSHHFMPDLALKLRCVIGRSIRKEQH